MTLVLLLNGCPRWIGPNRNLNRKGSEVDYIIVGTSIPIAQALGNEFAKISLVEFGVLSMHYL
jgi:hypothetical protein